MSVIPVNEYFGIASEPEIILWLPYTINTEKFRQKYGVPSGIGNEEFMDGKIWRGNSIYRPRIKTSGFGGDVGIDLFCVEPYVIGPHNYHVFDTFVVFYFQPWQYGLIRPRGGDNFAVLSGVVDPSYTGTVKVKILNPYVNPMSFQPGDSIGQLVPTMVGCHSGINLSEENHDEVQNAANEYWQSLHTNARKDSGRING